MSSSVSAKNTLDHKHTPTPADDGEDLLAAGTFLAAARVASNVGAYQHTDTATGLREVRDSWPLPPFWRLLMCFCFAARRHVKLQLIALHCTRLR
jgi:hypothetical protein